MNYENSNSGMYQRRNQGTNEQVSPWSTFPSPVLDPVQQLLLNEIKSLKNEVSFMKHGPQESQGVFIRKDLGSQNQYSPQRSYQSSILSRSTGRSGVVLLENIPLNMTNPDIVYYMLSRYGNVERVKILKDNPSAIVQFESPEMADRAFNEQGLLNKTGTNMNVKICDNIAEVTMPDYIKGDQGRTKDFTGKVPHHEANTGSPLYGTGNIHGNMRGSGNCLLISKIPEVVAKPDFIFNIFGNYGDVQRVKILHKKPDTAIIQLANPTQAMHCVRFLDQVKLHGNRLTVRPSDIPSVQLPQDDDDEKTKDYSSLRIHRFHNPAAALRMQKKMSHPSSILHISNLPEGMIDPLKEYFIESGFTVKDIRALEKFEGPKTKMSMALIELSDIEEAIMALGMLHNTKPKSIPYELPNGRGIWISFSNVKDMDKYFK